MEKTIADLTLNEHEAKDIVNILQFKVQNEGFRNKRYLIEIIEPTEPNTFLLLDQGYIKGISWGNLTSAFVKRVRENEREVVMSILYHIEKKEKTVNFYNSNPRIKGQEWYFLANPIRIDNSFSKDNFFMAYVDFRDKMEKSKSKA
ncbi:MAG: hypothetical protein IB618_03995 [Candidatus Pacearchaeota archaeon]|nr:MAG: hypothetical protein IB618_03995 [Candidatus Pacearchaeota archaeon]